MRVLAHAATRPAREHDGGDDRRPNVAARGQWSVSADRGLAAPDAVALRRLASKLLRHAPHDGVFPLPLPGTYALRVGRITAEPVYATLRPSLCVVAQGAKIVMVGSEVLDYDAARMLVLAVDLPVAGQVTRASSREPFLGFRLDLDAERVAELAARVFPNGIPRSSEAGAAYVGMTDDAIIDAVARLVDLMAQPDDAQLLGPVVVDEILIRLLRSPVGRRVAQLGQPSSAFQRIADAVTWIREHFAQPVTVQEMAAIAHMSASSFHDRFKAVTAMSPLQYQKAIRLHEARRLMLFQSLDVTDAAGKVGYVSASQFSREYARMFGGPPAKDIARLRDQGFASPR
jgi:AraC-like DNA-binding protein